MIKKYLKSEKTAKTVFYLIIALCFSPIISAPVALLLGFIVSFLKIKPAGFDTSKMTKYLLQSSIVLMGFGMNLSQVLKTSETGFGITVVTVTSTLLAGLLLGYFLKVDRKTTLLISSGTAICGGSAIAAVSPVINAKSYQMSFALAVVFVLNGVALFLFPYIGHHLHLSQKAFGYWAAIAIHDTSSVVGAGSAFGPKALQVATTVKLTRALWIIPLSLFLAFINKKGKNKKINIPWFIGLFVIALVFSHFATSWTNTFQHLSWLGKKGLFVALFLIGTSLSVSEIKKAGFKSFLMGFLLWILISTFSLTFIMS